MSLELIYNIGIGILVFVSMFSIMRNNVVKLQEKNKTQESKIEDLEKFKNENKPLLEFLTKAQKEQNEKITKQAEQIVSLKEKVGQAPTMKEVRAEFVSKEIFNQMEKHIVDKVETSFLNVGKQIAEMSKKQEQMLIKMSEIQKK